MILRRDDPLTQIVVPDHKELDRGILRAIIRQAGLNVDVFMDLLQGRSRAGSPLLIAVTAVGRRKPIGFSSPAPECRCDPSAGNPRR